MEGTPFGRYRLLTLLGQGGMGEVWRARDTATDRIVAVKLLPPQLIRDDMFVKRFRREAHAAARLNNPHVIPIHTYGEIEGRLYVDMRLIEGHDMEHVLARGPMDVEPAVRIIEQMANALNAAHKVGLVHRDVKPSNILLDEDDFAYLIDFGIARAADDPGLTGTGAMIGTWHYMAPERMTDAEVDARSDIYSLACVLHEFLTGKRPFPGDSMESQVAAHLTAPPPRPSVARLDVPAQFDVVIATGMAKNPAVRYPTTVALARAARDALTAPPPRRRPEPPTAEVSGPISGPMSGPMRRLATPPPVSGPASGPMRRLATPPPTLGPASGPMRRLATPVPSQPRSPKPTPPGRPWWRRKATLISAAILCVIAVAVAVTIVITRDQRQSNLPFADLGSPSGVAVDNSGSVYVTDNTGRVLRLESGSRDPDVLPFGDLKNPGGVAVNDGTVYVTERQQNKLLKWVEGQPSPTELSTNLNSPTGVAVDKTGTVYIADGTGVLKLPAGPLSPSELGNVEQPRGVAVDRDGNVYVTDIFSNQVLKFEGSTPKPVGFTGLDSPLGVAVDGEGSVYVADSDNNRVLKLAAGSNNQVELPFTGLNQPTGVAVDKDGNVFVADSANSRVVKLAPE